MTRALDAGADWIVGPLRQESVAAILELAGMTTPMLALNDLPADYAAPPGLEGRVLGLSLSQEAEAGAVAVRAAAQGFENALVLAPESEWGERMVRAFEEEFLQEDRQIVGAARYLESQNDHSSVLERLLKIDASEARKKLLENTLQMPLEFEPARREDVDVIFLAASSMQAKLIRPQLRFLDAGDIPVYATGRVFSGQPDPAGNQDLDGLRFPALPWQLQHADKESIPEIASLRGGALSSLFAVGQDAWNVLPWLDLQTFTPWVIAALLPVAAVSLRCFVRGSQVALTFHTMTGRAEVLRLTANFGCVRNFRRAARDISTAIRQARAADKFGDSRFLRMEMQAHYRLLESGVIGREACSRGTAKILARFG